MKKVSKNQLLNFKRMGPLNRESYKIDYNMLTKYYRVIHAGETKGASVSPFEALKLMVKGSEMWEIPLGKPRSGVSLKGSKT